jgi:hypothetical protein
LRANDGFLIQITQCPVDAAAQVDGRLERRVRQARGLDAVAGAEDEGRTAAGDRLGLFKKERDMTATLKKRMEGLLLTG